MEYEMIGLHWRGGENDATATSEYLSQNLKNIYVRLFGTFSSLLNTPPIVLHKLVCVDRMNDMDPTGERLEKMHFMNQIFSELEREYGNISVFDPVVVPQFIPDVRGNGIFMEDMVHFTTEVNKWIAEDIFRTYSNI